MITTHVLDTARGRPGAGIRVVLECHQHGSWREIGWGTTDADGRLTTLMPGESLAPGMYRLTFHTGEYHNAQGLADTFFPTVKVTFKVASSEEHYHVPLLLSPFGYSTYRGT
jgi:5-hydroxyisourate hydrolase